MTEDDTHDTCAISVKLAMLAASLASTKTLEWRYWKRKWRALTQVGCQWRKLMYFYLFYREQVYWMLMYGTLIMNKLMMNELSWSARRQRESRIQCTRFHSKRSFHTVKCCSIQRIYYVILLGPQRTLCSILSLVLLGERCLHLSKGIFSASNFLRKIRT